MADKGLHKIDLLNLWLNLLIINILDLSVFPLHIFHNRFLLTYCIWAHKHSLSLSTHINKPSNVPEMINTQKFSVWLLHYICKTKLITQEKTASFLSTLMEHMNSLFGFLWPLLRKSKSQTGVLSFPVLFSVHWLIVWERKPVQFLSKEFIPEECESSSLLDFKWAITSLLTGDFLAPLCPSSFNSVYLKSLEKLKQRTLNASKSSLPLLDNVKHLKKKVSFEQSPCIKQKRRRDLKLRAAEDVEVWMEVTVNIVLANATGCPAGQNQRVL